MRAFLETVEKAGYFVGLYCSRSPLMNLVDNDIRQKYTIWVAEWANKTCYPDPYDMWQRACNGDVKGISGNVDLDICYKHFPSIIKRKGLNNYGTSGSCIADICIDPNPVSDGRVKQPAEDGTVGCILKIGDERCELLRRMVLRIDLHGDLLCLTAVVAHQFDHLEIFA